MKQAEREITGSDEISEHVEMAGWGVEEATEANKKEASKYPAQVYVWILRRHYVVIDLKSFN